jgi:hypothetical protein
LLFRGLLDILVIVPTLGIAASIVLGLDLAEKVGITLIVIAPGSVQMGWTTPAASVCHSTGR